MRPAPRIKFIWGAGKVIRGRWYAGLFGFYDRVEGEPDSGLAISLRGVLAWGAMAAVLAYVALASVLYWGFWDKNPYNRLTYADALLYPLRRPQIAEKKGQAFIAQGQAMFLEKKYHDAANLLRLGLARYPHDTHARKTLAQYYLMANQRPVALRVLQDGLTDVYPEREYMQSLFAVAEQAEDYALVLATTERYAAIAPEAERRWLMERRFAALSNLGRHEEALALAEKAGDAEQAQEAKVVALLGLGRIDEAWRVLEAWKRRPGATKAVAVRLAVRAAREGKRFDDMSAALAELRELVPGEAAPLIFGVVQWAMAERMTEARAALDDYLFRYAGQPIGVMLVAEPLAQIGAVELLQVCVNTAKEQGYPLQRLQSLLVESLALRGEWDAARRELSTIAPTPGREAALAQAWHDWMERVIEAGKTPTEASQLALLEIMRQRPWPVQLFKKTVEALRVAGRIDAARETVALAARTFPASPWAQAELKRLGELADARVGPETRGPSGSAAELDEEIFWARLEKAVAEKRWTEAQQRIQQAWSARPVPAWLATREAALRLVQVRVSQGVGDGTAMLAAARNYLNGDAKRSQQILEAAREFADDGDQTAALSLAREVARRAPDFTPAKKLVNELEQARAKAASGS